MTQLDTVIKTIKTRNSKGQFAPKVTVDKSIARRLRSNKLYRFADELDALTQHKAKSYPNSYSAEFVRNVEASMDLVGTRTQFEELFNECYLATCSQRKDLNKRAAVKFAKWIKTGNILEA